MTRTIDSEVGKLRFWGSECLRCGCTTEATMTCDSCGSSGDTTALWMDVSARYVS